MEPSPRKKNNLFAGTAIVLLLIVILTAEMASVAGDINTCKHLSGSFRGWCLNNDHCIDTCVNESSDNFGGECLDFIPRCYCIANCSP
ncbi:unnamed protein product [Urochloa decumbens]|uniref:Knottins-like domain-containing protein n=1 Tax=Urochloa decumbens TaxID=240449 RepID=A0ABC9B290_9POAL